MVDRDTTSTNTFDIASFIVRYDALPTGYSEGIYHGRRYGITKTVTETRKRGNLFAKELGGTDHISFNLYRLNSGVRLKPCEMPEAKVVAFVMNVKVDE